LRALRILLDIQLQPQAEVSRARESAIPWPCLDAAGLGANFVRELVDACYLEHFLETTCEASKGRTFVPAASAVLTPRSSLLLTVRGIVYAQELIADLADVPPVRRARPVWDRDGGELWWEGGLVKRFRHDAANQRLVLDGFEMARWSRCIRNP